MQLGVARMCAEIGLCVGGRLRVNRFCCSLEGNLQRGSEEWKFLVRTTCF